MSRDRHQLTAIHGGKFGGYFSGILAAYKRSLLKGSQQGQAQGDGTKVTEPNLRFPAVFLRKSSVFCAKIFALKMLEIPGEGVNLQKSAVF